MSLKYRDASGVETPVAGLNGTSGELVPSTALLQSGTDVSFGAVNSGQRVSVRVSFTTPMPNNDYVVQFETQSSIYDSMVYNVHSKSTSGFQVVATNANANNETDVTGKWTAFKLITDEAREADEAAIAQNTSDIANKCLKYTQLTSADNINNLIAPGNYGGYNGDGVGGTFPYTGNSQFSLLVTRAREYRYQLLQSGADVWQRYTGVSGDVPTGWSAWMRMINEKVGYHRCIWAKTNTSGSSLTQTLSMIDGQCYTIEAYQGDNYRRDRVYLFSGALRSSTEHTSGTATSAMLSYTLSGTELTITFPSWSYTQCRIYVESPANGNTIS